MIEDFNSGMIPAKIRMSQLAKYIDHSLLHPTMTDKDLEDGCMIALKYNTATVCIKPYAVRKAVTLLASSEVAVCTVIGFPQGSNTQETKVRETIEACENGATEIDMVINIGKVLSGDWIYVSKEINSIHSVCKKNGAKSKVIFENDFLNTAHKIKLCEICSEAGVDFVKTSTGYGYVKQDNGMFMTRGATLDDINLMKKHCSPEIKIKAAGGIRSLQDMLKFIDAGASRIGATATESILEAVANADSFRSEVKKSEERGTQPIDPTLSGFDY